VEAHPLLGIRLAFSRIGQVVATLVEISVHNWSCLTRDIMSSIEQEPSSVSAIQGAERSRKRMRSHYRLEAVIVGDLKGILSFEL
jgi:hypothetical protein